LEREIERLRREIEKLREKIEEDAREIRERDKRIDDLERQLAEHKRSSADSSKPPSSVEQPYEESQQQLPQKPVLNVDETGWRNNGDKRNISALVARKFVFYVVSASRGSEVLVTLLGIVFGGILCSDRAACCLKYHSGPMQFCLAHLKRALLRIADSARSPSARRFARAVLATVARLSRLWHRFRGDLRNRRGITQPTDRAQLVQKSLT